jgi:hypothetical protein
MHWNAKMMLFAIERSFIMVRKEKNALQFLGLTYQVLFVGEY